MQRSAEFTLSLLALAKAGSTEAQAILVEQNIPLVKSIVRRYLGRGLEYDDLFQIGSIGLIKAIQNFDPVYAVQFSTYAVPMIAGEIRRFLRDDGSLKVSRLYKQQNACLLEARQLLQEQLHREPSLQELAGHTGLSPEEAAAALDACRPVLSLEAPLGADADSATLADTLCAPIDALHIDKILLKQLLLTLPPRERQIVLLRYFSDKTQEEIASVIGVSQVQISRILQKVLAKLRNFFTDL